MMVKYAKLFLLLLGFALIPVIAVAFKSKKEKVVDYEIYVNEVVNQFSREMEIEYDMKCIGVGGGMPHDVEEIYVCFHAHARPTLVEARILEVTAIEKFLKIINFHEKLRPFLREYPFTASRIGVSISFRDNNNEYYFDSSIAYVNQVRNNLYYYKADPLLHDIVKCSEEPYETALKIVNETKKK